MPNPKLQLVLLSGLSIYNNDCKRNDLFDILATNQTGDVVGLNRLLNEFATMQGDNGFDLWICINFNFLLKHEKTWVKEGSRCWLLHCSEGAYNIIKTSKSCFFNLKHFEGLVRLIDKGIDIEKRVLLNYGHGAVLGIFPSLSPEKIENHEPYANSLFQYYRLKFKDLLLSRLMAKITTANGHTFKVILNTELAAVISKAYAQKFNVVVNYSCTLQNTETMYALKEIGNVLVGTPTGINVPYLNFSAFLSSILENDLEWSRLLIAAPDLSGDMANDLKGKPYFLSAVDLNLLQDIKNHFKKWADLLNSSREGKHAILRLLENSDKGPALESYSYKDSNSVFLSVKILQIISEYESISESAKQATKELGDYLAALGSNHYYNTYFGALYQDCLLNLNDFPIFIPVDFQADFVRIAYGKTKNNFLDGIIQKPPRNAFTYLKALHA